MHKPLMRWHCMVRFVLVAYNSTLREQKLAHGPRIVMFLLTELCFDTVVNVMAKAVSTWWSR